MKIELTREMFLSGLKWTVVCLVLITLFIIIPSLLLFGVAPECCANTSLVLSDANINSGDKNWLVGLVYSGGFCERLGLSSGVVVQQDSNGNTWGVPVCVQAKSGA